MDVVLSAYQRRMEQEDAQAAHYTAWLMQPHTKKSVKPDSLRRIKPQKRMDKTGKAHDKRPPRATREELIESVRKMPKKTRPKR